MRNEAKMATPSPAERQAILTDIGRRLDHPPIGPMHRKVVVAIGLGLFFEVYEIFLSSTIATALKTQYGLGGRALELLLASSFVGMFIGAAVFGRLADRIGRRPGRARGLARPDGARDAVHLGRPFADQDWPDMAMVQDGAATASRAGKPLCATAVSVSAVRTHLR